MGPDEAAQPSKMIGKYEIRQLLGRGGMGEVHLGFDPLIEREVAIKILAEKISENERALKRFLAEARAVGKLNHPNCIAIYDIDKDSGRYFIVMELARGGSVAALLKDRVRLPLQEAGQIAIQAAHGLQAAHAAGLIHRDVKPENLMLASDNVVKLVDFGVAKDVDRKSEMAMTADGQMVGTPLYMSPEQIEAKSIDARTDIYSLGASFYYLLTGEPPFMGDSITQVLLAHVRDDRPDPQKLDPELPVGCGQLIAKAMAIDPAERYQSMLELITDLQTLLDGPQVDVRNQAAASTTIDLDLITPHVMIIEPSKLRSKVTTDLFRKAGCLDPVCILNPDQAVRHAETHPLDVAIASRQLGEFTGEQVLRRIRQANSSPQLMCILVSSDPPDQLVAQAPLEATVAYVKKQASPDELLRAVHASTGLTFLRLPFSKGSRREVRAGIVSPDGAVPDDLVDWVRTAGVATRSLAETLGSDLRNHDLIIWLAAASSGGGEFPECLSGSTAGDLLDRCSTLAIVQSTADGMRLRAVRRQAFVAVCDRKLDNDSLQRLMEIV